ncbi:MAG: RNA methyltransferase [Patescibacteria group bacterium]|jgi:tRNA G18 (ribose-2'-O)-methylase SpoU
MAKLVLVLHNIRSRFNVGAIFRTADAAGIDKLYLTGITPAPPHPKIEKVSLGAEQFIPYEKHRQTSRLLKKLKLGGYQIIALEQSRRSISYFQYRPHFPLALIIGNEVTGLPDSILKLCHKVIEIPMHGRKESLNVAIATGIVIFDIINR